MTPRLRLAAPRYSRMVPSVQPSSWPGATLNWPPAPVASTSPVALSTVTSPSASTEAIRSAGEPNCWKLTRSPTAKACPFATGTASRGGSAGSLLVDAALNAEPLAGKVRASVGAAPPWVMLPSMVSVDVVSSRAMATPVVTWPSR